MRTKDFVRVLAFLFITKEIVADSCTEQHFKEISSKIVSIIYNRLYYTILSVQDIFKYFIYVYIRGHIFTTFTQEKPETRASLP